ncbi:hypothetical protein, partial [Pseudomonas sp. 2995-3]|uniref:hypothetical protein n=1 Tax=Pseudomonas sp. 2995-3 TaxID=1712680 RepID=UPI0013042532
ISESEFEDFYQLIKTENVIKLGEEYKTAILSWLEDMDENLKQRYMDEILDMAQSIDPDFYEMYPSLLYNLFAADPAEFIRGLSETEMSSEQSIIVSLTQYGKETN